MGYRRILIKKIPWAEMVFGSTLSVEGFELSDAMSALEV